MATVQIGDLRCGNFEGLLETVRQTKRDVILSWQGMQVPPVFEVAREACSHRSPSLSSVTIVLTDGM